MPNRLFKATDQVSNLTAVIDPGTDTVPGNVQKMAFVMLNTTPFPFDAAKIKTLNAWQTAVSKPTLDAGLVVITPFLENFEISATTPLTNGGNDTSTPNGAPRLQGTSFAAGKARISGASSAQIQQLRTLTAKTGNFQHGTRLGVYLLHEENGITCISDFKPIPIYNFFVGDAKKGGSIGQPNEHEIEFHFLGGWSTNESVIDAAFEVGTLTNVVPNP